MSDNMENYSTQDGERVIKASKQWTQTDFIDNGQRIMNEIINPMKNSMSAIRYEITQKFVFGALKRMSGQKHQLTEIKNGHIKQKKVIKELIEEKRELYNEVFELKEMLEDFFEHIEKDPPSGERLIYIQKSQSFVRRLKEEMNTRTPTEPKGRGA